MNGPVSDSMRIQGLTQYHINWGITLPHLREMAEEVRHAELHKHDHSDALPCNDRQPSTATLFSACLELWQDNVRESKLMALMLMPTHEFTPDLAQLWAEQLLTNEIAEHAAMLLYQHLPYAAPLAFRFIALDDPLQAQLGWAIIGRLLRQGSTPDQRGLDELRDQYQALHATFLAAQHPSPPSSPHPSPLLPLYHTATNTMNIISNS